MKSEISLTKNKQPENKLPLPSALSEKVVDAKVDPDELEDLIAELIHYKDEYDWEVQKKSDQQNYFKNQFIEHLKKRAHELLKNDYPTIIEDNKERLILLNSVLIIKIFPDNEIIQAIKNSLTNYFKYAIIVSKTNELNFTKKNYFYETFLFAKNIIGIFHFQVSQRPFPDSEEFSRNLIEIYNFYAEKFNTKNKNSKVSLYHENGFIDLDLDEDQKITITKNGSIFPFLQLAPPIFNHDVYDILIEESENKIIKSLNLTTSNKKINYQDDLTVFIQYLFIKFKIFDAHLFNYKLSECEKILNNIEENVNLALEFYEKKLNKMNKTQFLLLNILKNFIYSKIFNLTLEKNKLKKEDSNLLEIKSIAIKSINQIDENIELVKKQINQYASHNPELDKYIYIMYIKITDCYEMLFSMYHIHIDFSYPIQSLKIGCFSDDVKNESKSELIISKSKKGVKSHVVMDSADSIPTVQQLINAFGLISIRPDNSLFFKIIETNLESKTDQLESDDQEVKPKKKKKKKKNVKKEQSDPSHQSNVVLQKNLSDALIVEKIQVKSDQESNYSNASVSAKSVVVVASHEKSRKRKKNKKGIILSSVSSLSIESEDKESALLTEKDKPLNPLAENAITEGKSENEINKEKIKGEDKDSQNKKVIDEEQELKFVNENQEKKTNRKSKRKAKSLELKLKIDEKPKNILQQPSEHILDDSQKISDEASHTLNIEMLKPLIPDQKDNQIKKDSLAAQSQLLEVQEKTIEKQPIEFQQSIKENSKESNLLLCPQLQQLDQSESIDVKLESLDLPKILSVSSSNSFFFQEEKENEKTLELPLSILLTPTQYEIKEKEQIYISSDIKLDLRDNSSVSRASFSSDELDRLSIDSNSLSDASSFISERTDGFEDLEDSEFFSEDGWLPLRQFPAKNLEVWTFFEKFQQEVANKGALLTIFYGGMFRGILLGSPINDYDIMVIMPDDPDKIELIEKLMSSKGRKVKQVAGLYKIEFSDPRNFKKIIQIDINLKVKGKHAISDFTCNSLRGISVNSPKGVMIQIQYHIQCFPQEIFPTAKNVEEFFNKKVLCAPVKDPHQHLEKDLIRILRGFNLCVKENFYPEPNLLKAIQALSCKLKNGKSIEQISYFLNKLPEKLDLNIIESAHQFDLLFSLFANLENNREQIKNRLITLLSSQLGFRFSFYDLFSLQKMGCWPKFDTRTQLITIVVFKKEIFLKKPQNILILLKITQKNKVGLPENFQILMNEFSTNSLYELNNQRFEIFWKAIQFELGSFLINSNLWINSLLLFYTGTIAILFPGANHQLLYNPKYRDYFWKKLLEPLNISDLLNIFLAGELLKTIDPSNSQILKKPDYKIIKNLRQERYKPLLARSHYNLGIQTSFIFETAKSLSKFFSPVMRNNSPYPAGFLVYPSCPWFSWSSRVSYLLLPHQWPLNEYLYPARAYLFLFTHQQSEPPQAHFQGLNVSKLGNPRLFGAARFHRPPKPPKNNSNNSEATSFLQNLGQVKTM